MKNCKETIRTLFDPPPPAGLEIGGAQLEDKLCKYCMILSQILLLTGLAILSADPSPQCGLISAIVPASVCCNALTSLPLMAVIFLNLLLLLGMEEGKVLNTRVCYSLMAALSVVRFLNYWLPYHL